MSNAGPPFPLPPVTPTTGGPIQEAPRPDPSQIERHLPRTAAERLPVRLAEAARAVRVEGRVVEQSADGTARLRTAEGDIIVRTNEKLPEGRRVTVDIPAERPARQVEISLHRAESPPRPARTGRTAPPPPAGRETETPPPRPGTIIRARLIPPPPDTQQTQQTPPRSASTTQAQAPAAQPAQPAPPAVQAQQLDQLLTRLFGFDRAALLQAKATLQAIQTSETLPRELLQALRTLNAQPAIRPAAPQAKPAPPQAPPQTPSIQAPQPPAQSAPARPAIPLQFTPPAPPLPQTLQLPPQITQFLPILRTPVPATPQAQTLTQVQAQATPLQTLQLLAAKLDAPQPAQALQPATAPVLKPATPQDVDLRLLKLTLPKDSGLSRPGVSPQVILAKDPIPAPPLPNLPVLIGNVTGTTPQGQVMVNTNQGQFILPPDIQLPRGAVLSFQLVPQPAATETQPVIIPPLDPLFGEDWPALKEALEIITHNAPAAAAQAARATIPTPTAQFTPTTLFFMAALRLGELGAWLGERHLEILRQSGRTDLLNRLGGDFGRLSAQSTDLVGGEWRLVPLPLLHDEQISRLQLFIRKRDDEDKEDKEEKERRHRRSRFLLDMKLSRMGRLQLDGLYQDRNLDIVLRSRDSFSPGLTRDIKSRYLGLLDATGLTGGISFQQKGQGWINIDTGRSSPDVLA